MRYKAMFAVGFAAGFIVGARAGRERYDQIMKYSRQLAESPTVQRATRTVTDKTTEFTRTAAAQMPRVMETARQRAGDRLPGPFGGKGGGAGALMDDGSDGHRAYPADPGHASVNGLPYTADEA
jgi:hypothetical protein